MAGNYSRAKGRKEAGDFFMFPKAVWKCENYKSLSHIARSLLLDIAMQFNGKNNGDLTACYRDLTELGWKSNTTIKKHIDELIYYGFIVCVQRGGINSGSKQRPNLYALTWLQINRVSFSDGYEDSTPWKVGDTPGTWKKTKPAYYQSNPKKPSPNKKVKGSSCSSPVPARVAEVVNYG